jgi:LPXTG-motif cell wall-anchored protein
LKSSNVDDGLADTGASAGSVVGLGAGLLLIVAGSLLLGRRRLSL